MKIPKVQCPHCKLLYSIELNHSCEASDGSDTLECGLCHKRTSKVQVEDRNYRTGLCANCGSSNLVPVPVELDGLLTISIAQLMIGKDYPNIGQIVIKIKPTILSWKDREVKKARQSEVQELKKWCGVSGDYHSEQMCIDRLAQLSKKEASDDN